MAEKKNAPPARKLPSEQAAGVVEDRHKKYGHPADVYERAAMIWTGILHHKLKSAIETEDVAMCQEGLKLAREAQNPNVVEDNLVDGCGYWDVLALIYEGKSADV